MRQGWDMGLGMGRGMGTDRAKDHRLGAEWHCGLPRLCVCLVKNARLLSNKREEATLAFGRPRGKSLGSQAYPRIWAALRPFGGSWVAYGQGIFGPWPKKRPGTQDSRAR